MHPFAHMRHSGAGRVHQRDDIFEGFGPRSMGNGGFGRGRGGHGRGEGLIEGRGRGGRIFGHGGLRLVLLSLIAERPSHGYELIKTIEDKLDGAYAPSPGVVYPILTWCEELGYATVVASPDGRKLFTITEAGQAFLMENASAVAESMGRMEQGRAKGTGRPPQIVRAIENFKTALHLRLKGEPLTPEQIDSIADILDNAAKSVERV